MTDGPEYPLDAVQAAVAEGRYWLSAKALREMTRARIGIARFSREIALLTPDCYLRSEESLHPAYLGEQYDVYCRRVAPRTGFWTKLVLDGPLVRIISAHPTRWPPR